MRVARRIVLGLWAPLILTFAIGCGPRLGVPPDGSVAKNCEPDGTDSDGDGISDADEDINGNGLVDTGECDPNSADTDGDMLPDSVEVGCDGLYVPGETRCDNQDTDGDGLTDGFEDSNGNGIWEPGLGETNPAAADSDDDGCTDAEEFIMMTNPNDADTDGDSIIDSFEDRNCDGIIDPAQGETSPLNGDTDGDGTPDALEPTFICNPPTKFTSGGIRPVDFVESFQGDWRIAIEASSMDENRTVTFTDLTMNGVGVPPTDIRAAAAFEYEEIGAGGAVEVAGFIMSIPLDANGDGAIDANMADHFQTRDRFMGLVASSFGGTTIRSTGNAIVSWEGVFNAVVGTSIEVSGGGMSVGDLRNQLFPLFFGMPMADFTNLNPGFGGAAGSYIITFETLWRAPPIASIAYPGRVVVMGAVVSSAAYDDPNTKAAIRANDLANGTGLAQFGDSDDDECDLFDVVALPVADILWVVDDSGSTDSYRTGIKDNAVDFFDRAIAAGLDFRMSVIGMGPSATNGFICLPPPGATVPPLGVQCPAPSGTGYNPQSVDGRWLLPTERDAFGWCVCGPPNGSGGTEYGLETGRAAILHPNMIPRDSSNIRKLRAEATLVVIYVGDEYAQGPGYTMTTPPAFGSGNWVNYVQPQLDMLMGVANGANAYPPGASPVDTIGRAHGIVDIDGSCPFANQRSNGYMEVVAGLGGQVGSVCAGSLGPTLQLIIDDIIGSASPVVLDRTPISLSLACAVNDTEVERSRVMGFDYAAASNSVIFFGLGMMLQDADVACSYKYPIDDTPFPDGTGMGPIG